MVAQISPADAHEIQRLAREGASVAEVVKATGRPHTTVSRYFVLAGVPLPRRDLNEADHDAIAALQDTGLGPIAIATHLGLNRTAVTRRIAETRPAAPADRAQPPTDWMADAICTQHDPETFHPHSTDRIGIELAKSICTQHCTVRDACLEWALATGDQYAVLGGTDPAERNRIRRNRTRTRTDQNGAA